MRESYSAGLREREERHGREMGEVREELQEARETCREQVRRGGGEHVRRGGGEEGRREGASLVYLYPL